MLAPVSLLFEQAELEGSVDVGGDSEYRELQKQCLGTGRHKACSPVNQVVSQRGSAERGGRRAPRSLSPMPIPSLPGSPDTEDVCPVSEQLWQMGVEVCFTTLEGIELRLC